MPSRKLELVLIVDAANFIVYGIEVVSNTRILVDANTNAENSKVFVYDFNITTLVWEKTSELDPSNTNGTENFRNQMELLSSLAMLLNTQETLQALVTD